MTTTGDRPAETPAQRQYEANKATIPAWDKACAERDRQNAKGGKR